MYTYVYRQDNLIIIKFKWAEYIVIIVIITVYVLYYCIIVVLFIPLRCNLYLNIVQSLPVLCAFPAALLQRHNLAAAFEA